MHHGKTSSPPQETVPAAVTATPETTDLLLEAFNLFTKASDSLEAAYSQLQQRTESLSLELEATNHKLVQNLEEKERVRNYLNTILESLPCGVLVVDWPGAVTICNPLAARLLSIPAERAESLPRPYRDLLGPHRLVEPMAACLTDPAHRLVDLELQDDPAGPVLAVSSSPMRSPSGALVGVTFIIKDMSRIKQLEAQTKRSDRVSAMGEMAVELAHEIRNPLASIELLANLVCKAVPAGTDPAVWAGHIRVGVRSLNTILSNMLHFARDLAPAIRPIDMHTLIEETLAFTGPLLQSRAITLVKSYAAAPPTVPGDAELLKQVFLNLIFNAMQAMPDSGCLEIATGDYADAAAPGERFLEIRFKDTGIGIDAEHLDKIFDPYFTTTKTGTGLGLAVVNRIIENHRGRILVESRVRHGTTFTIRLPRVRPTAAHPGRARAHSAGPSLNPAPPLSDLRISGGTL